MARREQFEMSKEQRKRRRFSASFKKKKVREIERGETQVSEVCRQYSVSDTSVYRWLSKYGVDAKGEERLIVETESDTVALMESRKKIAELERVVGQKQILIDFLEKMIGLAEEHYQVDIKKKFTTERLNRSGKTEKG